MRICFACLLVLLLVRCAPAQDVDAIQLLTDVKILAADSLEGRQAGSEGASKARRYLQTRLAHIGVSPVDSEYVEVVGPYAQPFTFEGGDGEVQGVNLISKIEGIAVPDSFMVLTAHYDHVGVQNGDIYNGADDNASGTAAVLALAAYFKEHPPRHSMIIALLDAEEMGLRGATAITQFPPVPTSQMVLNVNLDMVSRNTDDELYAAGTAHYPFLKPALEDVAERSKIHLLFGHDGNEGDDWTMASDHGRFHQAGIPFVYFGVEDHADYHQASDEYVRIDPAFYIRATETILDAVRTLDAFLGADPEESK
ncbi:MAG TPA: M28 family peptidase [Rhodothermales bacterium]|nr:M28 family peptidase [Rhodothermales bacterium]